MSTPTSDLTSALLDAHREIHRLEAEAAQVPALVRQLADLQQRLERAELASRTAQEATERAARSDRRAERAEALLEALKAELPRRRARAAAMVAEAEASAARYALQQRQERAKDPADQWPVEEWTRQLQALADVRTIATRADARLAELEDVGDLLGQLERETLAGLRRWLA